MEQRKCRNDGCRKKAQQGRAVCRPCRTIAERERNPVRYSWLNGRKNARHRGIPWSLTLEEYESIAVPSGYMARKGRFKFSLHMDRKEEDVGYHYENMQVLPNHENVKKALTWRWMTDEQRMEFKMQVVIISSDQGSCPF